MSVLLALVVYAVAVLAPRWLTGAAWTQGSPRLGILAWQASTAAVLGSVILLAVAAALPVDQVSFDLGHLLHACGAVLRSRYSLSAAPWSAVLAAATAAVLLRRALLLRSVALVQARKRQRALIDVLALELADDGTRVLDHQAALAYCIPGRGGRIVLTSAAVSTLTPDQLAAVIAHERAHLRGRHDVVLFASEVARAAFPWVRFFGVAKEQTAGLVEMLADDQAARQAGPVPLASALVGLGSSAVPGGSLAATGQMTTERVLRLVRDPYGVGAWRHAIVLLVSLPCWQHPGSSPWHRPGRLGGATVRSPDPDAEPSPRQRLWQPSPA
jgi:Zn-dependent protease with chaperone function